MVTLPLALLLPLFSQTHSAQPETAGLRVRVENAADDSVMPGVTVELSGQGRAVRRRAITGADGTAVFRNLEAAEDYHLTIKFTGFGSWRREGVSVQESALTEVLAELHRFESQSLVSLLAHPKAHDGKHIQVVGFCVLEFENTSLYLHKEDAEAALLMNSIWLVIPPESLREWRTLNRRYVLVEGVFSASEHGHMDLFSGTIAAVERLTPWEGR